eukprot:1894417-Amphidinium_carterae.1
MIRAESKQAFGNRREPSEMHRFRKKKHHDIKNGLQHANSLRRPIRRPSLHHAVSGNVAKTLNINLLQHASTESEEGK